MKSAHVLIMTEENIFRFVAHTRHAHVRIYFMRS